MNLIKLTCWLVKELRILSVEGEREKQQGHVRKGGANHI